MAKKKRKREEVPTIRWDTQPTWINTLIGEGVLAFCVMGRAYHLSRNMMLPPIVLGIWLLASVCLGQYANARDYDADSSWWRDYGHEHKI